MTQYPKRLIEVDLPIARISAHARREKSIRHGHISTLHIWWARRPLAACRAVICASLWPDPADPLCPPAFREAAVREITAFAKQVFPERLTEEGKLLSSEKHLSPESRERWEEIASGTVTLDAAEESDWGILRFCLLDFIADFANWDNSTVPAYLGTSRALTQEAHEALGGTPGTRPLVVDPFAGGGSIPLEALRVGADAFASDLNPVAVLLNKVVLEYIPKYGNTEIKMQDADRKEVTFHGLAEAVRYWGKWVKDQAQQGLTEFYPKDPDGSMPIAYLWARTILSEAPGQGEIPVEVPLIRSLWLCKKPKRKVALRWRRDESGTVQTETVDVTYADGVTRAVRRPLLEIFEPKRDSDIENGTVARGSATCPVTGYTTPVASVRKQLKLRKGGASDSRLFCVVINKEGEGRSYRPPCKFDFDAIRKAEEAANKKCSSGFEWPSEPTPMGGGSGAGRAFSQRNYGMDTFSDLFTPRQLAVLALLVRKIWQIRELAGRKKNCDENSAADAVQAILGMAVSRYTDIYNSLCMWETSKTQVRHAFTRQAIPMLWDYAEACALADAAGNYSVTLNTMIRVLEYGDTTMQPGHASPADAASHPLPDDAASAFISDPPYYDAVPYSDLSDFFYVWLKRTLPSELRNAFLDDVAPKSPECIVDEVKGKDRAYFESTMMHAMAEGRRVLTPNGIGVLVFAHKSTGGWEALLQAMVDAGWTITGSWPIDTELGNRLRAMGSAALASSVHLVCRPRETSDGEVTESVGEWRDVLSELPGRIHDWMPRLAAEGVVGADAIFACLGPALEIFSRYSRVEKASGEEATLREYLEHVWAAVSTEALSVIFRDADAAGLEPDARLTAMWLWTLGAGSGKPANGNGESSDDSEKVTASTGYTLEFDAARKIAQGLGVHLEKSESIVEVKGDKARLLPVSERTKHLFGKDTQSGPSGVRKKKAKQQTFFDELDEAEAAEAGWTDLKGPPPGSTVLDRLHQTMILFAAGRGELMKRFLVEEGVGGDARFWKLAQSLSALYPVGTDEKRWVDGVLSRKKGLGL